jgi:hypothetical protein
MFFFSGGIFFGKKCSRVMIYGAVRAFTNGQKFLFLIFAGRSIKLTRAVKTNLKGKKLTSELQICKLKSRLGEPDSAKNAFLQAK